jgi:glucokinase
MIKTSFGVDIGGSHVSCAACDIEEKNYLPQTLSENDLDTHAPAADIIDAWGKTIRATMNKAESGDTAGIGFAMPGPFDYEKGISLLTGDNKKYEGIYGLNVSDAIRVYLKLSADIPVRFINDATAFAIGEDWMGSASGFSRSLSITLGTGFGSAFLENGLPVVTGDKVPDMGCLYHLPFEGGNADDFFSTRGLVERYYQRTGIRLAGGRELANAARHDSGANEVFQDFGVKLADLLEPWLKKFRVEVLVIGGNISRAFYLFGPSFQAALNNKKLNVEVRISELMETAAIVGSARLAEENFWKRVSPLLKDM